MKSLINGTATVPGLIPHQHPKNLSYLGTIKFTAGYDNYAVINSYAYRFPGNAAIEERRGHSPKYSSYSVLNGPTCEFNVIQTFWGLPFKKVKGLNLLKSTSPLVGWDSKTMTHHVCLQECKALSISLCRMLPTVFKLGKVGGL